MILPHRTINSASVHTFPLWRSAATEPFPPDSVQVFFADSHCDEVTSLDLTHHLLQAFVIQGTENQNGRGIDARV